MTRSCSCSDEGPGENRCRNTHLTTTQIFSSTYRLQTTENTSKSKKRSTTAAKSSSPPRSYKMHIIKLSSIFIRTKSTKPTTITPKATPSKAIPSRGKASTMLLKDTTTQNYHTSKGRMITQKNHTSKGLITRQKYHTSKGRITRQRYHTSRKPTQTTKPLTPTTSSDNDTGESVYNRNHTMTRVKKLKSSTRIIDTVKGTPSSKFSPYFILIKLLYAPWTHFDRYLHFTCFKCIALFIFSTWLLLIAALFQLIELPC